MEEVAIMVPASTTIINDDLSDETESINLDLHVSDTEDSTESPKKGDQIESEEEILNKYIDDSAENIQESEKSKDKHEEAPLPNGAKSLPSEATTNYEKCNGTASPILGEIQDENGDMETVLENDDKEEEKQEEVINADVEETLLKEPEEISEVNEEKMDEDIEEEAKSESEVEKIEDECEKVSSQETNKETSDLQCDDSDETNNDKTIVDSEISDEKPNNSPQTIDNIDELPKQTDNSNSDEVSDKDKSESQSSNEDETAATKTSTTTTKTTDESKTDELEDNDDLLCVMEEKTEDETTEHKDENSCSASEKDDETKDPEHEDETKDHEQEEETKDHEQEEDRESEEKEQEQEESTDETKEDEEMIEENHESQLDIDMDNSEIAMDIEESDIGGVVYSDHDQSRDSKTLPDKDANKENELESDPVVVSKSSSADSTNVVKENGLTNGDIDEVVEKQAEGDDKPAGVDVENNDDSLKKSTKRQLSDTSTEGESPKKIKLTKEPEIEKPLPEKRSIYLLDNFKKFMLDKKLKKLTRFELEELCMQKMCECIINKSEIGELRQKVLLQEQTIDTWRKEAIVVAKQTRDLKIVHERLMADLKVMKEQAGKPLVPVKITRSVGLQAIIENPTRVRSLPIISAPTNTPQPRTPVVNNQNKPVASPQNRQQVKPKVIQRPQNNARPLQPITQKNNVNNAKTKPVVASSPQQKKPADSKTVIDLTDEDEKNHKAKKTNTASPTVRVLNKQTTNTSNNNNTKQVVTSPNSQASKIMFVSPNVLQRNSAVMVKMNSNGLVSPQNGLTTIPNGQVSVVTTPSVRTVSQVRVPVTSVATVRTTSSVSQTKQFKHPAPLPAAPNYQISAAGKKPIPPKPHLNLTRSSCGTGIVLQWKMPYKLDAYEPIVSYQLYAYQETKSLPKTDNWGKIGDVKALELPMAVTLTQFAVGNRYFFAVRAVDSQKRLGPFSEPESILL